MKRLFPSREGLRFIASLLEHDFKLCKPPCPTCGRKRIFRRDPEYWCPKCQHGSLWRETKDEIGGFPMTPDDVYRFPPNTLN